MGDEINKKITADASQANRELVKLQNEVEKLKAHLKEMHHHSEEHSNAFSEHMHEQVGAIKGMVVELFSVQKAVEFVSEAYEKWFEEIKKVGEASEKHLATVQKTLTLSGDLAAVGTNREFIENAPLQMGLTREQAAEAFKAAAGTRVSGEMARELVEQSAPLAAAFGGDKEALAGHVKRSGNLAEVMPGMSANDAGDVALFMSQQAGDRRDELGDKAYLQGVRAITESGAMNSDEALGAGLVALQNHLPAKFVTKMASMFEKQLDVPELVRGKEDSPENQVKRRLNAMSPADRLAYLQANPDAANAVFGAQDALKFREIKAGEFQAMGQKIKEAREGNYAAEWAEHGTDEEVREMQRRAVRKDQAKKIEEPRGREIAAAEDELEIANRGKGPFAKVVRQTAAGAALKFGGAGPEGALAAADYGEERAPAGLAAVNPVVAILYKIYQELSAEKPAARATAANAAHNE